MEQFASFSALAYLATPSFPDRRFDHDCKTKRLQIDFTKTASGGRVPCNNFPSSGNVEMDFSRIPSLWSFVPAFPRVARPERDHVERLGHVTEFPELNLSTMLTNSREFPLSNFSKKFERSDARTFFSTRGPLCNPRRRRLGHASRARIRIHHV